MKLFKFALVFTGTFSSLAQASPMSFDEVRTRVYSKPLSSLPSYPSVGAKEVFNALLGKTTELTDRIVGTLTNPTDFKSDRPKILHPMGVCAEAIWKIDRSTGFTGLLEKGTEIPAIVRFSTGDQNTVFDEGQPRVFGLAIKLFPSTARDEKVVSRNIFTLDHSGLDGEIRKSYLRPNSKDNPLYFENVARGSGFAAKLLVRIFNRFDSDPTIRPLYPITEVTASNQAVQNARTPKTIRFIPKAAGSSILHQYSDFRDEILSYRAEEIRFEIWVEGSLVGNLTVGRPVISNSCDRELHFQHHPTR